MKGFRMQITKDVNIMEKYFPNEFFKGKEQAKSESRDASPTKLRYEANQITGFLYVQ